jgi:hypothetical protein
MATIIRHTDANQFLFRKKKFLFIFCWIQKQQKIKLCLNYFSPRKLAKFSEVQKHRPVFHCFMPGARCCTTFLDRNLQIFNLPAAALPAHWAGNVCQGCYAKKSFITLGRVLS